MKVLPIAAKPDTVDRVLSMVPDAVDKLAETFNKKKSAEEKTEE